jgi:hypothetical protein
LRTRILDLSTTCTVEPYGVVNDYEEYVSDLSDCAISKVCVHEMVECVWQPGFNRKGRMGCLSTITLFAELGCRFDRGKAPERDSVARQKDA